jgi:O-antigen ligase
MKFIFFEKERSIWSSLVSLFLFFYLLFSMISISASQIFVFLAIISFLMFLIREKQKFTFPSFFWLIIGYAFFSLLSSFFSVNPGMSLADSRELLLFLIVPVVYTGFSRKEDISLANYALLTSASLSSLYSIFDFFFLASPGERASGFMGHYMTQAGLLLLFSCLALSKIVFFRHKTRWLWAGALLLSLVALSLTLTRSAWVGLVVAAVIILLLYKPQTLIIIPVLVGLFFLLSPQYMKRRALSIFSLKSYSNQQRIQYLKAGLKIIEEFPLLGTGPDTVDMVFQDPKYELSAEARRNVHLHNNLIQIAAERGIPTFLLWLSFMVWIFISLTKLIRNKSPSLRLLAGASMAAVAALFSSGLFEYNFADSEITMLFLYLVTLPFSFRRIERKESKSTQ